jgi:transposase-like protein
MSRKIKKGKQLINLVGVVCPKCGAEQPILRMPKSTREIFKGGWTCKNCGCEMDRFGKEIGIEISPKL